MTGRFAIRAHRLVRAERAEVFAFLADLENHWLIADRFVEVVELTGPPGARTGGRVRIRGPFGVQRVARTQVDFARPVDEMGGSAQIGEVTTAQVRWLLRAGDGGTAVTLAAQVERAGPRDRLLLTLGGRAWMRRRFATTLQTLDGRLADGPQWHERAGRRRPSMDKRRFTTALGKRVVNPVVESAVERGIAPPSYAILETTGRRSGLPRRTPVGNGLDGDTFWLVAEHGRRAAYVRNIEADPRVRVKVRGRWREGLATLVPDDDPRERQRRIGLRFNAAVVRAMGTDLLSVRVDLAPAGAPSRDDGADDHTVGDVVGDLGQRGQGPDAREATPDDAQVERRDRQSGERTGGDRAPSG